MFILANPNKFDHLLIDAELRTDDAIAEATELSRSTVRALRRGEECSPETVHTILGVLLRKAEEVKTSKSVMS